MKLRLIVACALAAGATMGFAKESIVFVAAHPDDTEGFAGTAFLLREKYDIHVVDVTRGELGLGMPGFKDGSTAKTRMAEEREACRYLGATPHFLFEKDGFACAGQESVDALAKLLKELNPRAVFMHWPIDSHSDHVQATALAVHALQEAGMRPKKTRPERYFYEVLRGQTLNWHPIYSVDISSTITNKQEMLRKYVCQNSGDGMVREKTEQAAARGTERYPHVPFAETFTTYSGLVIPGGVLEDLPGVCPRKEEGK